VRFPTLSGPPSASNGARGRREAGSPADAEFECGAVRRIAEPHVFDPFARRAALAAVARRRQNRHARLPRRAERLREDAAPLPPARPAGDGRKTAANGTAKEKKFIFVR